MSTSNIYFSVPNSGGRGGAKFGGNRYVKITHNYA